MRLDGFKFQDIFGLAAHWTRHSGDPDQERHTYRNVNIDPARTHLNYALGVEHDEYEAVVRAILTKADEVGGARTKNTNVCGSWVVTLPGDWEGEPGAFFRAAFEEMSAQVGRDNVIGGWVHMDETTPHMHFVFSPRTEVGLTASDKTRPLRWTRADEARNPAHKAGTVKRTRRGTVRYEKRPVLDSDGRQVTERRLSLSSMWPKARMKGVHDEAAAGINRRLREAGDARTVSLRLKEDDWLGKALSDVPHSKLAAAEAAVRREIEARTTEAAEREREAREAAERERGGLAELRAQVAEERGRLERLRRRGAELERERGRLEGEESDLRARVAGSRERREIVQDSRERERVARERAERAQLGISEAKREMRLLEKEAGDCERETRQLASQIRDVQGRIRRAVQACRDLAERLSVGAMPRKVVLVVERALEALAIEPPWRAEARAYDIASGVSRRREAEEAARGMGATREREAEDARREREYESWRRYFEDRDALQDGSYDRRYRDEALYEGQGGLAQEAGDRARRGGEETRRESGWRPGRRR